MQSLKVRQNIIFSSRCFFQEKRINEFNFTTMISQFDLFSFVFWKKLKTPKRHFEIIWPLATMYFEKTLGTYKGLEKRNFRSWQDSNLQSSDPKSDALSIWPHDLYILWQQDISNSKLQYGEITWKLQLILQRIVER